MDSKYNADSIEVLTGLEPIQLRPNMYTDTRSPLHLIQEIVDNSIDETRVPGASPVITLTTGADGSITIADKSRGIPIDIKEGYGISALRLVIETLHSGAKFYRNTQVKTSSYTTTAGLHGVGISVVTALSTLMEVTVCRGKTRVVATYKDGKFVSEDRTFHCGDTGTTVKFIPDPKYFVRPLDLIELKMLLRRRGAVTGVQINYTPPTGPMETIKEDLAAFVAATVWGGKAPHTIPFSFSYSYDGGDPIFVEGAVVAPISGSFRGVPSVSYYNGLLTVGGGDHAAAVNMAIKDALDPLYPAAIKSLILPEDEDFPALISVSVPGNYHVKLSAQTKDAVISNAVYELWKPLSKILTEHFAQHKRDALSFISFVETKVNKREQARKVAAASAAPPSIPMPSEKHFRKPRHFDPDRTEIFIVEGESASSGKGGLNRAYQGCLQLRGMAGNEYKSTTINQALAWVVQELPRINKVIIMSDADSAGTGIALSIIGTFWKNAPQMLLQGKLYRVHPPLFKVVSPDGEVTFYEDTLPDDVEGDVIRFKGVGSMDPADQAICYNPDTRSITQLKITEEEAEGMADFMNLMFSGSPDERREWLSG